TWGTATAINVFGNYAAPDPKKNITDIPGVFMIVSSPIESKIVPDYRSSRRNLTGTLYLVPESVQLDAALSYRKFSRLGVVYTPTEDNSVINVNQLKVEAAKRNIEVIEKPIPLDADKKPIASAIPGLVDQLAAAKVELIYQ